MAYLGDVRDVVGLQDNHSRACHLCCSVLPLTFCSVLGQAACPIAFWAGDLDAAERYGAMLLDHTERHPIRLWNVWARCFNGLVIVKRGDIAGGLQALRRGLEQAGDARFLPRFLL